MHPAITRSDTRGGLAFNEQISWESYKTLLKEIHPSIKKIVSYRQELLIKEDYTGAIEDITASKGEDTRLLRDIILSCDKNFERSEKIMVMFGSSCASVLTSSPAPFISSFPYLRVCPKIPF